MAWRMAPLFLGGEKFFHGLVPGVAEIGDGAMVMPASEFEERRVFVSVNVGEVVMGVGVIRIGLERFAEGGFGVGVFAFFAEDDAEIILRSGIGGIELGGAAQSGEGVVEAVLAIAQHAEEVEALIIVGVDARGVE